MNTPLSAETKAVLEAVFQRTDVTVARAIEDDRLHRSTAIFVLHTLTEEIERLDPRLGSHLTAKHSEAAVEAEKLAYGG